MDFLEAVTTIVPAVTDIAITIYNGEKEVLRQFERKYCFLADVQKIFTVEGLCSFLDKETGEYVYEIVEPMGMHLAALKIGEFWVLIGPYIETVWNEKLVQSLFMRLGIPNTKIPEYKSFRSQFPVAKKIYLINIIILIIENTVGNGNIQELKIIHTAPEQEIQVPIIQEEYKDIHILKKRYELEDCFINAVVSGKTELALEYLEKMTKGFVKKWFQAGNMKNEIMVASVLIFLMREAAEKAGLSLVMIDCMCQEYSQQVCQAISTEKLDQIKQQMVIHFCSIIRKEIQKDYSVYIKRATQYIDANLGKTIKIEEISEISGISKQYFVKLFSQETGMTIKQYIAKRRCEIASELLKDDKLSVQEIAMCVGYTDSNYFTKVFKSNTGYAPLNYRKMYGAHKKR